MSAGQTTQRYGVVQEVGRSPYRFQIIDYAPEFSLRVDAYRTRHLAESYARSLNRGVARVDSHAIVGCKVVAS